MVNDPYRKSYSRDKFFSNKALESDIRGGQYTSRFDAQRADSDQGFDSDKYHKQLSSAKDKFRFELEEDDFIKSLDWKLQDIKKSLRYVRAGLPDQSKPSKNEDVKKFE